MNSKNTVIRTLAGSGARVCSRKGGETHAAAIRRDSVKTNEYNLALMFKGSYLKKMCENN